MYIWLILVGVCALTFGAAMFCIFYGYYGSFDDAPGCMLFLYGVVLLVVAIALLWGVFSTEAHLLNAEMMKELCK